MASVTKIATKAKRAKRVAIEAVPLAASPREELRMLVRQHAATQIAKVGMLHRVRARKNRTTGETMPSRLAPDLCAATESFVKVTINPEIASLERRMNKALAQIPIYTSFLQHVFGVGTVLAAYLVSDVDIRIADKPSRLKRFCGLAIVSGRLERRTAGVKNAYNAGLRTKIFTAFAAMWKNAARFTVCDEHAKTRPGKSASQETKAAYRVACAACPACRATENPNGQTCKYLDIWRNAKHRELHSERVDVATNKWRDMNGKEHGGAAGHAHSKGWHKAADIMIDDLYIVWRALEGLPVWPTYYEAKLRHVHGGAPLASLAPVMLTLDEALARVRAGGDFAGHPAAVPVEDVEMSDPDVDADLEAEANEAAE